jgi:alpha-mannosidase
MNHTHRWTSEKIAQRIDLIEPLVYHRRVALPEWRYRKLESVSAPSMAQAELDDSDWSTIAINAMWGEIRAEFALRTRFSVPPEWDPRRVALFLPIGIANDFSHPETLAYIDGEPISSIDRHHQEIRVPAQFCDGGEHVVTLRGWCGGVRVDPAFKLAMRACALVEIHQPTRDFVALARVAHGIAVSLDENQPARYQLLTSLDNAFKLLDIREPVGPAFYESIPPAWEALNSGVERSGAPLPVDITAASHAHIDVAWLWPLSQTRRKAIRTFYNVVRLSAQFPDFIFTQSQPQLYDYVRRDAPALFAEIKAAVARGAWEPLGGMWVEADCNLSGGESLARQLLLGRAFFREHFGAGAESPVLWLPDVFGYAWNLPQLIKEAGLEYFFTIKIGWNQYNRLPYDSFWWQGLDGTRVLTHFSTTPEHPGQFRATYNGKASPDQIIQTWTNTVQKESATPGVYPPLLLCFGHGDGGGGPTREMIENVRLMGCFPATPHVHFGPVKDFFRRLEQDMGTSLPTWNGELYLELHRGTYTTQARNKLANRQSEFALHDAEFLAALAMHYDSTYSYPVEDLRQAWELVCLNQFHDIIPGSSIGEVYADSQEQYALVLGIAQAVRAAALNVIAAQTGAAVLVVNPTSFPRHESAFLPTTEALTLRAPDGALLPVQPVNGGLLFDPGVLPPYSIVSFSADPVGVGLVPTFFRADEEPNPPAPFPERKGEELGKGLPPSLEGRAGERFCSPLLENAFLRVEFSPAGDLIRIYDKANDREVLSPGALANQFQAFEDRPRKYDAWDVEIFYDDKQWLAAPAESIRLVEAGPLRATLEIRRRMLNSEIVQRISLSAFSARLDFATTVQWCERHVFLKVAFPVDILSPQATYEIQWGNVQRPTHRNTSWDWARFETCAQKWVDLSEGGYGVALLNDSKYGHDIQGNVIRLSLLRAPTNPDPEADQGEQHFTYSLFPHAGSWDEGTIAQAYFLNDPLIVTVAQAKDRVSLPQIPASFSLFSVDTPNVIIETVKAAEDGQGLILRLYESQRERGPVTLTCAFPISAAWRANLLEENQHPLEVTGNTVIFPIRPYQIVTLRIACQA